MKVQRQPAAWVIPLALAISPAPSPAAADGPAASIEVQPGREIVFRAGPEVVTRYHIAPTLAKPFFWPLNAPGGLALTRPWPMEKVPGEDEDHVHQKSAWFCHGDVIPEGIPLKHQIKGVEGLDFWSESPGHGHIVCTHVGRTHQEGGHAWVDTANEWRTADGDKVLDESRTIHLYDLGTARLLVLDFDLCASTFPVTFGDTKEGALGVRVRTAMTEKKGKGRITNAEGKTGEGRLNNVEKKGCWGLISAWCDYSGPAGDTTAGLALVADPANPYPTAWHSRGYGLMAANPFGRARSGFPDLRGQTRLVRLAKGEHLKLRYGLLLHTGDVRQGAVASYYERFVKLGSKP
jgi:hypothetical protein